MRSEATATAFLLFMVIGGFMAVAGCQQTASRLTWSFARDSGLIASSKLSHIDRRWQVPIWALCANGLVIFIIGCIYLGSSTAFNAFIGTGLILQLITFAFPAALLLARGRPTEFLPSTRTFGLPRAFGWVANFFTVAFAILCLIFYDFPAVRPVTASSMSKLSAPGLYLMQFFSNRLRLCISRHWRNEHLRCHKLVHACKEMLPRTSDTRSSSVVTWQCCSFMDTHHSITIQSLNR